MIETTELSAELANLELEARDLHESMRTHVGRLAVDSWKLGEVLNKAKEHVGHGNFSAWLEAVGINQSTANKCQRLRATCTLDEAQTQSRRQLLGENRTGTNLQKRKVEVHAKPSPPDPLPQRVKELEAQVQFFEDQARPEGMERLTELRNLQTYQQTLRAMIFNLWNRGDEYKRTREARDLYKELFPPHE